MSLKMAEGLDGWRMENEGTLNTLEDFCCT